jgi:hypothetical protein
MDMTSWHADDTLIAQYLRGEAGALPAAGLEQHLTACAHCRARIADRVEVAPLELIWDRIQEEVQAPATSPVQRLLTRVGVPEPDALLIAVAPSLRTSWLLGLAITLGFVGLGAAYGGTRGLAGFLLVAPLVPMAGVALAYGPDVDPSYEVGAAAPYSAVRLLLLRTAAVLATSLPLTLAAGLSVPGLSWTAASWLLPALALTALVLAASTWVRPTVAAVGPGLTWLCAVGAAALEHRPSAVLAPELLIAYATLGLGAMLVLHLRIRHLTPRRSLP